MTITLRKSQLEANIKVRKAWRNGTNRVLVVMPTGTGKTEMFLSCLSQEMKPGQRGLIIAHRRELIHQPMERIALHWPKLYQMGTGIMMASQNQSAAAVVVATVQTLATGRVGDLLDCGKIDYLVTDEAHHSVADTYGYVYEELEAANPNLKHLGVTATPVRTDEVGLKAIFDEVVYRYTIPQAVKDGALCPFVGLGVYVPAKFENIKVSSATGDWTDKGVGEAMGSAAVESVIISTYKSRVDGEPAIAFCATVDQAHSLAARFRAEGYRASSADHTTKKDLRRAMLDEFKAGRVDILCNYGLWTEGVDLPNARVALLARPTKSPLTYLQMAGRVLRTWPGKDKAILLDFVPEDERDLIMAGDLLEGRPRPEKKAVTQAEQNGVVLDCFGIDREGRGIDVPPDQILVKVLSYFSKSTLAWTQGNGYATCGISDRRTLAVLLPKVEAQRRLDKASRLRRAGQDLAQWSTELDRLMWDARFRLYSIEKKKHPETGKTIRTEVLQVADSDTWEEVSLSAEGYASEYADPTLARRAKRWRGQDASEAQIKWLRRADLWREGITKGEAAQRLTHHWTGQTLKNRRYI